MCSLSSISSKTTNPPRKLHMQHTERLILALGVVLLNATATAQEFPLGEGPWYYDTYSPEGKIKVSVVAKGITNPWGMAILPSGNFLIAQQGGGLRIIRDGVLDPNVIGGTPEV